MGVNKVILLGRLGRDPELKYTAQQTPVCTFSLATSERVKHKDGNKEEKTEWHNVVVWGKRGEIANQYLQKGKEIYLEGKIVTRSWDDKSGQKKYRTEVIATDIQFVSGKDNKQQSRQTNMFGEDDAGNRNEHVQPATSAPQPTAQYDDDCPF